MTPQPDGRRAVAKVAPLVLWFAVLGGAGAWSLHLVVGWGLEEIACGSGSVGSDILGIGLVAWLTAITIVLGAVTVAALLLSWRLWRQAGRPIHGDADPPVGRAGFMALYGLLSNGLFLLMIVFGGVSLLFLGPCLS